MRNVFASILFFLIVISVGFITWKFLSKTFDPILTPVYEKSYDDGFRLGKRNAELDKKINSSEYKKGYKDGYNSVGGKS